MAERGLDEQRLQVLGAVRPSAASEYMFMVRSLDRAKRRPVAALGDAASADESGASARRTPALDIRAPNTARIRRAGT
jgi:hypothetical protein